MCRSLSEGGRRCSCSTAQKRKATDRRRENRSYFTHAIKSVQPLIGHEASNELKKLSPNKLYAYSMIMEEYFPNISTKLLGNRESFPGIHNMIVENTRDRSSNQGKKLNNKKLDHFYIEKVGKAAALARYNLYSSDTIKYKKELLIAQAQLDSYTTFLQGTKEEIHHYLSSPSILEEDNEKMNHYKDFLAKHSRQALVHIYDDHKIINDKLWDQAFSHAHVETGSRKLSSKFADLFSSPELYRQAKFSFLPQESIGHRIAEGVIARNKGESVEIIVDGVILEISSDSSISETLAKLPKILSISAPDNLPQSVENNQWKPILKLLLADADKGKESLRTLHQEFITRMISSSMKLDEDAFGSRKYRRRHDINELLQSIRSPRKTAYKSCPTPIALEKILEHKDSLEEYKDIRSVSEMIKEKKIRNGRMKFTELKELTPVVEDKSEEYGKLKFIANSTFSSKLTTHPPYTPFQISQSIKGRARPGKKIGKGIQAHEFNLEHTATLINNKYDDNNPTTALRKSQLDKAFRDIRSEIIKSPFTSQTLGVCVVQKIIPLPIEKLESFITILFPIGKVISTHGYIIGSGSSVTDETRKFSTVEIRYHTRELVYQLNTRVISDKSRYVVHTVKRASAKKIIITLIHENEIS